MTIDNTQGQQSRRAYFGYQGNDPYSAMRMIGGPEGGKLTGVGQGRLTAIMSTDDGLYPALGFTLDKILQEKHVENLAFGLGRTAALLMEVPAGEKRTYQFAVCFTAVASSLPVWIRRTGIPDISRISRKLASMPWIVSTH